jgi:hypothetical protein
MNWRVKNLNEDERKPFSVEVVWGSSGARRPASEHLRLRPTTPAVGCPAEPTCGESRRRIAGFPFAAKRRLLGHCEQSPQS